MLGVWPRQQIGGWAKACGGDSCQASEVSHQGVDGLVRPKGILNQLLLSKEAVSVAASPVTALADTGSGGAGSDEALEGASAAGRDR